MPKESKKHFFLWYRKVNIDLFVVLGRDGVKCVRYAALVFLQKFSMVTIVKSIVSSPCEGKRQYDSCLQSS